MTKVRSTTTIRPESLKRAKLAATLTGRSVTDFVSSAADKAAAPVLRKHGMEPKAEPCAA